MHFLAWLEILSILWDQFLSGGKISFLYKTALVLETVTGQRRLHIVLKMSSKFIVGRRPHSSQLTAHSFSLSLSLSCIHSVFTVLCIRSYRPAHDQDSLQSCSILQLRPRGQRRQGNRVSTHSLLLALPLADAQCPKNWGEDWPMLFYTWLF